MGTASLAVLFVICIFSSCKAAVVECPDDVCDCTDDVNGILSDCSESNLTDIPDGFDKNTMVIDLSDNNIDHLRNDSFSNGNTTLVKLTTVILQHNIINEIEPGAFSVIDSLSELDLESNLIGKIEPGTFSENPDLIILKLGNNSLEDFPVDVITLTNHIQELDVSYNSINEVDNYEVRKYYPELKRLDISNNEISHFYTSCPMDGSSLEVFDVSSNYIAEIDPSTFSNMSKLKEVNVSNNQLTDLDPDIFASNPYLVKVDISRNHIIVIQESVFSRNPVIEEIYAGYNNMTYIHPDTFGNNSRLTNVIVSWNSIEELDPNTFSNNPNLETVDLNNNKLTTLDPDTFVNNPDLKYLDLRSNYLVTVHETTFRNNPNLEHFFVSKNEHIRLHNGFLIHATTLKVFDAQHCNLSELPADLFNKSDLVQLNVGNNNLSSLDGITTDNTGYIDTLTKLEVLDLSNNRLQTINVEVFTNNLTQLKTLRIDGNPFICDCDLRNAWLWSQQVGIIPSEPKITCMNNQTDYLDWDTVQNLTCSDEENITEMTTEANAILPTDESVKSRINTTKQSVIISTTHLANTTHSLNKSTYDIEWFDMSQDNEPNPKIEPSTYDTYEGDRSNKIMIGVSLFILLAVVLIIIPLLCVMRKKYGTYKLPSNRTKDGKVIKPSPSA